MIAMIVPALTKQQLEEYKTSNKPVCVVDTDDKQAICGLLLSIGDQRSRLVRDEAFRFNTLFYDPSILKKQHEVTIQHYWYKDRPITFDPKTLQIIDVDNDYKEMMYIPENTPNPAYYQAKKISDYVKKRGNIIRVVYPPIITQHMTLNQAIKKALQYTAWSGNEAGFTYDVKTKKIISPIISNDNNAYDMPSTLSLRSDLNAIVGDFHTHPSYRSLGKIDQEREKCVLSSPDLRHFESESVEQAMLGCENSQIITLSIKKIPRGIWEKALDFPYHEEKGIEELVDIYGKKSQIQLPKKHIDFYHNSHLLAENLK